MPEIKLTTEHQRRIKAFAPLYRSVMNREADAQTLFDTLIDQGFRSVLADFLHTADHAMLVEFVQQLAGRDPDFVSRYMADMIALGDDVSRRQRRPKRRKIGFRPSSWT